MRRQIKVNVKERICKEGTAIDLVETPIPAAKSEKRI